MTNELNRVHQAEACERDDNILKSFGASETEGAQVEVE